MSNTPIKNKITSEQDYQLIQATLTAGRKPSKTLRFLMNLFENYRQERKIGWSRPWNKHNVINFQSFKLTQSDKELFTEALHIIKEECSDIPAELYAFVEELLDPGNLCKGFLFFQEFEQNNELFEGAVLSFGRVNQHNRKYRDRLDLILESPIVDGKSQGLSRLRVYIDPFCLENKEAFFYQKNVLAKSKSQHLFERLSNISWDWAFNKEKIWDHWVNQYIDYFGERKAPPKESYFFNQNTINNQQLVSSFLNKNKAA